jgi:flagellar motor switch/type III secretory pathway protein FliN
VDSISTTTAVKQGQLNATVAVPPHGKHADPGRLLPWLPCTLALEVPVVGFTVGSLLKLVRGSLVQTSCHQSMDIPLQVNGILMAWTEFEVVGERLAARITDLV